MPNPVLVVAYPLILLSGALVFLPVTIGKLVLAGDWGTLTSLRRFQDAWFGTMWNVFAPSARKAHEARIVPLLQGKVRAGSKVTTAEHPPVHGTVIEVGPGTGNWVSSFSDSAAGAKVDRVYGVEPNPALHPGLLQSVKAAGLQGKYEVVPVGIEDLAKAGIPKGSVDCIATLMCLCCIPEPERNIRELYEYLRPGGQWYVYEHVKSHGPMRLYQWLLNLVWPHMMGSCDLCRNTEAKLLKAGPWSNIDLAKPADEPWYAPIPHLMGVLTK